MPVEAPRKRPGGFFVVQYRRETLNAPRRPLHHVTPTEVYIRVAAALIKRAYRQEPESFGAYPAPRIERLAEQLRSSGLPVLTPWLKAAARHVAQGMPLRTWEQSMPWDWNRAVFKQQWRKR